MNVKTDIEKIVLALDVETFDEAISIARELKDFIGMFKIGKQLFTRYGPSIIHEIQNLGGKIFLDLKFHDIPNTIANASREAVRLKVNIFNIHASGGTEMMKAAVKSVKLASEEFKCEPPKIIAVTVLTSINQEILKNDLKCDSSLKDQVINFARKARQCGLDGVVASPQEIDTLRKHCGNDFIILTPGIRPKWSLKNDQKRVMTPEQAIQQGADYIVIGRPILNASDRVLAARKIISEIASKH